MTLNTRSLKTQLKTVGRLPKFLALLGASSLVIPIFSYGASAATVFPSARLGQNVHVVSGVVTNDLVNYRKTISSDLRSKSSHKSNVRGLVRSVTDFRNNGHHGSSTTTTAPAPTTTAPAPTTTAPAPTTTAPAPTTTAPAPTTTAPAPTTTVASGNPQPYGQVGGNWNLIFDSEFNGSSLNTSKWSTGWFGSGVTVGPNSLEQECMDPAQVSVANGELDLTAIQKTETCGGVTQPYTSGMVTTNGHFNFTYGYMEARVWLPGSAGVADWPAFWLIGPSWPASGEIDVMEGLGGLVQAHLHASSSSMGPLTGTGTFTGGWHTFGANWQPGSITFYYDGISIGTFTSLVPSAPMYLILNMSLSTAITSPNVAPADMRVDYVRVWQN